MSNSDLKALDSVKFVVYLVEDCAISKNLHVNTVSFTFLTIKQSHKSNCYHAAPPQPANVSIHPLGSQAINKNIAAIFHANAINFASGSTFCPLSAEIC
jgi:hypothetical protein